MGTCERRRSSKAVLTIALAGLALVPLSGQAPWKMPRTADGRPDLQGTWSNATITLVERPKEFPNLVLTKEQAARLEKDVVERTQKLAEPSDPDRPAPPKGGDGSTGAAGNVGGYNDFWIDSGTTVAVVNGQPRSSLIVDPPDGRIPPMTAEGEKRAADRIAALRARGGQYDHPEFRPLAERCLLSFGSSSGPPMLPNYFYNNNYQIVQTADHIMILVEMVHDVRVIRMNAKQHLPKHMRPWLGDSIGRWEGDTLVVETTNFHPAQTEVRNFHPYSATRGLSDDYRVIERFTRVDADTILYKFTVDDPATFTRPWSGEVPFKATSDPIYEYACHEGNYALSNVLSGERNREARSKTQQK
jgi:hypothetical protein